MDHRVIDLRHVQPSHTNAPQGRCSPGADRSFRAAAADSCARDTVAACRRSAMADLRSFMVPARGTAFGACRVHREVPDEDRGSHLRLLGRGQLDSGFLSFRCVADDPDPPCVSFPRHE